MMDLILWRHAEALDESEEMEDLQRPLTSRGEKQAARMAAWLDRQLPDGAQEVQRVIAERRREALPPPRQVIRRNRAMIMSELRRRWIAGDGPEQVEARAALIDQAWSDSRASIRGSHDRSAARGAARDPSDTDISDTQLKAKAGKTDPASSARSCLGSGRNCLAA